VTGPSTGPEPPLFLVRGDATPQEVAALVAVLQAAAAAAPAADDRPARSEWSAPRRAVQRPPQHGPGAWRASALPR
jgi:hypothetical protein